MEKDISANAFSALGHDGRLAVFRLLARRAPHGVRPSEIAGALGIRANTLSNHLAALERAGLARSAREGRSVFYRMDVGRAADLVDFLVNDCCRGRPELCTPLAAGSLQRTIAGDPAMTDRVFNVLFVCTGNSARSIFAEALLRTAGGERFRAFSAGARPRSEPNPLALTVLRGHGHDVSRIRTKNLSEFRAEGAPQLDFVFTVCDRAANEECPAWPGQPMTAHWGVPDPAQAEGTEAERALAFQHAYQALRRRIECFVALPVATLDRISLQNRVDEIGAGPAADNDARAG